MKKHYLLLGLLGFLIPSLEMVIIIGHNSKELFNHTIFNVSLVLLIFSIIGFIFCLHKIYNSKKSFRLKRWLKILYLIILCLYFLACSTLAVLLYGPNNKFREWLITTAMQTMNHQYLCKWFYNDDAIDLVLNSNYIIESGESTNTAMIKKHNFKYRKDNYENEYEKEILDVDDDIKYQIIELTVNGCNGYLAVIYDPSMVKLAYTDKLGYSGEYVTTMADKNNAILGINGAGFNDPEYSSLGGMPLGILISNGKIITNGEYGTNNQGGGIIGFTYNDEFVLLKNTSAQEAINLGVRDAVSWGPFLIVNGEPSFIKGNGGWGYAARTAIGQRADGIVLMLVIDSNAYRTKGADMVDLTEIMQNYGAINAANLDGGTSSVMVMPKEIAKSKYNASCNDSKDINYCAINDPIDGGLSHRTRAISDAWIVVEN